MRTTNLVKLFLILLTLTFIGCGGMKIEKFNETSPRLVLEEFFNGKIRARGAFFSRGGELSTRLNLTATGKWDGKVLTLKEHLEYDSGEIHERTFYITKIDEHNYEARCDEFVGVGTIKSYGNALQWEYYLKENSKQAQGITLKFDDWMFLNKDGTIINRAQAYKWGFNAGQVQLFINKE